MKPANITLLVSALLAASYVAAPGVANAGGRECLAQSLSKTTAARMVDADLDAAIFVARTGRPVTKEVDTLDVSVKGENQAWLDFPNQCLIQDMLDHELADLQTRAAAFRAHESDLLHTQFQIVLGRFERAMGEIQAAWKVGRIADDIAEKTMYELRVEAFDYLQTLGTTDIRARLQEAIWEVVERGMNAEDRAIAQQQFFVKVYTIRLEAALATLQERGANGSATVEDLQRISQILVALERLQKFTTPYDCGS